MGKLESSLFSTFNFDSKYQPFKLGLHVACREEVYGWWKQLLASGEATSHVLSWPLDLTLSPNLLRPLLRIHDNDDEWRVVNGMGRVAMTRLILMIGFFMWPEKGALDWEWPGKLWAKWRKAIIYLFIFAFILLQVFRILYIAMQTNWDGH